jgi:hypothetical protein
LDDHLGLVDDELVSPPDILDLEGARLVLRPRAEGGGGLDKKGNNESLFFFESLLTSIASGGSGEDTAIRFPGGLNGLRGGSLGPALPATPEFDEMLFVLFVDSEDCSCFGAEIETEEVVRLGAGLLPSLKLLLDDLTLAVTFDANRLKGDMVRETAEAAPLPVRLLVPLVSLNVFLLNREGVER